MHKLICVSPLLLFGTLHSGHSTAADILHAPTQTLELSGNWLYHPGDNPAFARPSLDDLTWRQRYLPTMHTPWAFRWHGMGWYRYHVHIRDEAVSSTYMLSLGPAREVVEVYVNGALVASRGQFGSRLKGGARHEHLISLVPEGLLKPGRNVIALRVFDPSYHGGFPEGPLLLGPADDVLQQLPHSARWAVPIRVAIGLLALLLGFAQLVLNLGRRTNRDYGWLTGAGVFLAIIHLEGTGVFTAITPSLYLAMRLGDIAAPLAVMCLGSYFAARFDDSMSQRARIGRLVLVGWTAAVLLVPDSFVYLGADAALLVLGLVVTFFSAHLVAQAARRQDRSAIPIFTSLIALALLLVYDGIATSATSTLPSASPVGAVAMLLITTIVNTYNVNREHEGVLLRMLDVRRRLDTQVSATVLEASALASSDTKAFLEVVAQQVARELEVRRCSIILEKRDGSLRIRASVGLPKHAVYSNISKTDSIAGLCFTSGEVISPASLPPSMPSRKGAGHYVTDAFVAHPILYQGRIVGVLNLSDRNDGGHFSVSDERHIAETAENIGLVLSRLGDPYAAWTQQDEAEPPVEELDTSDLVQKVEKGAVATPLEPWPEQQGPVVLPEELAGSLDEETLDASFDQALAASMGVSESSDDSKS